MAEVKTVKRTSDISGKNIPEGKGARLRLLYDNPDLNTYTIDLTAQEAEEYQAMGRKTHKRGRPPKRQASAEQQAS